MSRFKIPKKFKSVARQALDPGGFNILGTTDMLVGKQDTVDTSAEEAAKDKALADRQAAADEFVAGGPARYERGEDMGWTHLSPAERQANSGMNDITTDPRYQEHKLAALRELEEQSQNGFTARDRADMARVDSSVNRANKGRLGAIQQNMQARGMAGSGMDLVAQLQSSQDANEIAAMRALEQEGMMQDRKTQATKDLGNLSSQYQGQDFSQEAAKAQAQDAINRFNTDNSNQNARYNNQGLNSANQANTQRGWSTSDRNSGAQYQYNQDRLGAKTGQATNNFNVATDGINRGLIQDQQNKDADTAGFRNVFNTAASVISSVKGAGGQPVNSYTPKANTYGGLDDPRKKNDGTMYAARGGRVPGYANGYDDYEDDTVSVMVSPGEVIVPESIAQDPVAAGQFVASAGDIPSRNGVDDRILNHLAKSDPSLVEKYRRQMGQAESNVASAKKGQQFAQWGDIAGNFVSATE